jgi:ribose 5-phosphate isomerase A
MIVIADRSKLVDTLGAFPLPIEVVPFGKEPTLRAIRELIGDLVEGDVVLRRAEDGCPVVTDSGHVILDGHFRKIHDPRALAATLVGIPGVVEHGLFLGLAGLAIIAGPNGVETLEPRGRAFADTARKIA